MSINFNGGMKAQGFGGVKPNANPNVNNGDNTEIGGELHASVNNRPEGVTRTQQVDVHSDGSYTVHPDNGDGKHVVIIHKPDGDIILDYENGRYNGQDGYSDEELDARQGRHGVYPPL